MTGFTADAALAGLNGQLGAGRRPALLLVDPARAYTEPTSQLYAGVEEEVAAMRRLLGACRTAGIPVVITRVVHEFPGDGGLFARKVPATRAFSAGNPLGEPIEGLETKAGEVLLTKQYPSAFFATSLAPTLTALNIDTVLIAGLSTSGCVRATALDALQHGFIPLVVREAVGDRLPDVHAQNLRDIEAKIGDVVSIDDIESYLTGLPAERQLTPGRGHERI